MALKYYFFNSKVTGGIHDRVYTSTDITSYLDKIVGSGVFPTPSDCLQVYAGTGLKVYVKPGQGWINGHKLINTADYALTLEPADVTLNRIDRIVFRVNNLKRLMEIAIKKGTNASNPVAPDIVRDDDIVEYSLAMVMINKRTETITDSMIRDTRLDSKVCGMVQGLIQQVGTDTLLKQWEDAFDRYYTAAQAEFDEWFDNIREKLTTSTLMREYRQIFETTQTDTTKIPITITQYLKDTDILNVYVNGMRLSDDEYTNTETEITLTKPLSVVGTQVEIVVCKSVDGKNAETVVGQVEKLQTKTNLLKKNVEIPVSAWTKAGDFYAADITNSQIDEKCMINVNFALESMAAAQAAEVQGTTIAKKSMCTIYAKRVPSKALVCDYVILRGEILS